MAEGLFETRGLVWNVRGIGGGRHIGDVMVRTGRLFLLRGHGGGAEQGKGTHNTRGLAVEGVLQVSASAAAGRHFWLMSKEVDDWVGLENFLAVE